MRPSISPCPALLGAIACWLGSASVALAQVPTPSVEPVPPIEPPIEPAPPVEPPPPVEPLGAPSVEAPPPPAAEPEAASPVRLRASVGIGVRAELVFDPDRNDQDEPVYTLNHNLRPYFNGQVHEYLKFEGNLDSNAGDIIVLDAIVKFEPSEYFNIWAGRFLPPSDRANLSGPYFQNAWTYPGTVHGYPSVYAGRNDGVAVWGQLEGGIVKWQLGAFDMGAGTPDPMLAGRLTVNVLDPEPGYYNASTYYGAKDVLAIGAVIQHRPAPEGAPDVVADTLWNVDALFEKSFSGAGTLDLEGAFYGFGGADAGTSFFVLGSFMIEPVLGIGRLQPMVRLQRTGWGDGDSYTAFGAEVTAPDGVDASLLTLDAGLHYVIDGHNARIALNYSHTRLDADIEDFDAANDGVLILGAQIQAF